jgi:hypothetical protein
MKEKDVFRRQLDDIKTESDLSKAIAKLADITYDMGLASCRETTLLATELYKLKEIICGNGDPVNSIIGRLVSVEKKVDSFTEDMKEIKTSFTKELTTIKELLVGGVNQRELSMRERVLKFEDYIKRSERLQWFILSAIVGYIVYQVLAAIF